MPLNPFQVGQSQVGGGDVVGHPPGESVAPDTAVLLDGPLSLRRPKPVKEGMRCPLATSEGVRLPSISGGVARQPMAASESVQRPYVKNEVMRGGRR